jgi:hypothetical protein
MRWSIPNAGTYWAGEVSGSYIAERGATQSADSIDRCKQAEYDTGKFRTRQVRRC